MTQESHIQNQSEVHHHIHTVLIVDDLYTNRYMLQIILEGTGYQVITATNGQEALECLSSEKIDAIISDILMPVMDGFKLCYTVKENPDWAYIPFIFYTASYTESRDRLFGLSLGADEYIIKPVEPDEFFKKIEDVFLRTVSTPQHQESKTILDDPTFYEQYSTIIGKKLTKKIGETEEQKATIRFSEERYQLFLQNFQGIGYLIRVGAAIPLIFEGQIMEITGYPRSDFLTGKQTWKAIIHPDDVDEYIRNFDESGITCGRKRDLEYRIIHKNGEFRWIRDILSCLPSQYADIFIIQGAIYDNTNQKRAEALIRSSEEYYRNLYETMVEGVVYQDEAGKVIDANPAAEHILGLTLDQLTGRTSMDPRWRSIHEDGSPFPGETHPAMIALQTGKKNQQIMGVFNPRDEQYHWILVNAVPKFRPESKKPYQVFTTFEDITEEKKAERYKIQHTKELQALLNLHLMKYDSDKEIYSYVLKSAMDITDSTIGFIALIHESESKAVFHVWSPEVMKSCSIPEPTTHIRSPKSGLWAECLKTRKAVIINDFSTRSDRGGYPHGHMPIMRFLEVPVLDGDRVVAIIAVANREESYNDTHADALNTVGNTMWEIIHRKRSEKELKTALSQIAQNMEQLATLNDTIRNPLAIITLIADLGEKEYYDTIIEAVNSIDKVVNRLDEGWIQSEKVRNFLIKHYQFKEEEF